MPSETSDPIEFIRSTDNDRVLEIWNFQLRETEELFRSCDMRTADQMECAHSWVDFYGLWGFQTDVAKQLMRHLNIGGSVWVGMFAYGLPIAGLLSQKYLFPRDRKLDVRLPAREIFGDDADRFRGRSAKYGRKNDPLLWVDAMDQVGEGWLPLLRYPLIGNRWNGVRNGIATLPDSVFFSQSRFAIAAI